MSETKPTREQAFDLLKTWNTSESLLNHALAVEAAMRYLARKHSEDEDMWGIIGLIHDLDYEQFPDRHCANTAEILSENNCPEAWTQGGLCPPKWHTTLKI